MLSVCAYLVLALYDENAISPKHSKRFTSGFPVKLCDRVVPFTFFRFFMTARVMFPEGRIAAAARFMAGVVSEKAFHVRGVQHYAVNFTVKIRQLPAIYSHGNIGSPDIVCSLADFLPENALSPSYVRYDCPFRDVQLQDLGENLRISPNMG